MRLWTSFWLPLALTSLSIGLTSCGAESNAYVPTRDSVETEAQIEFDALLKTITIVEAGPSVRSSVLSPCEISVETTNLTYQLVDAQNLLLNNSSYKKAGELSRPAAVAGVPDGLFAIWTSEARVIDQVSNQIEIEIQADILVYRNNCSR